MKFTKVIFFSLFTSTLALATTPPPVDTTPITQPILNPLINSLSEMSKENIDARLKQAKEALTPEHYLALLDVEKCISTITDDDLIAKNPALKNYSPTTDNSALKIAIKDAFIDKCQAEVAKYISFAK